jgi:hypothetical protein
MLIITEEARMVNFDLAARLRTIAAIRRYKKLIEI